mmetsp:Transcript_2533/g.4100  ORF Transcript_2533/g.4100 Transcript_2533/m.4100 type:complete len:254 (-) Transcript_2533:147-908(-)
MNKFILQFSRVEKAYREVEDAFILIAKSETHRTLHERMKRKCKMSDIKPILTHLGFDVTIFSDDELKDKFAQKELDQDKHLTFQRLLIGVGLCYFAKLQKEKTATQEKEHSGTEVEYNDDGAQKPKQDIVIPDHDEADNDNDDQKQTEEGKRFETLRLGFEVVKKMFDVIDENGNGEISYDEFEHAFTGICRDPDIVKSRMQELDYNNDQNISFREFIFGISSWCGFNDEMAQDDNDDDLDQDAPPSPQKAAQ